MTSFYTYALDTFGKRQEYSLVVYPNLHKIKKKLWKFELNWLSNLQENNKRKTPMLY